MEHRSASVTLPPIPAKRYFTIGEVSDLCAVKPHVLRYWEQEFTQLRPMKRRGNRRYYQHHEVLLIRKIRELLYDQGFTINGARNQLIEAKVNGAVVPAHGPASVEQGDDTGRPSSQSASIAATPNANLRSSLQEVLDLLRGGLPRL